MNSEDHPLNPELPQTEAQPNQSPERWVHPDTLKFMGMAKELIESPAVQQSIAAEQRKTQSDSTLEPSAQPEVLNQAMEPEPQHLANSSSEPAQPDTLDFRSMAKQLLDNSPGPSSPAE
ncbi:MAG TPA: hypothetical protein V6D03_07275 [Candidatus Caenarcaniphilales bacterium]